MAQQPAPVGRAKVCWVRIDGVHGAEGQQLPLSRVLPEQSATGVWPLPVTVVTLAGQRRDPCRFVAERPFGPRAGSPPAATPRWSWTAMPPEHVSRQIVGVAAHTGLDARTVSDFVVGAVASPQPNPQYRRCQDLPAVGQAARRGPQRCPVQSASRRDRRRRAARWPLSSQSAAPRARACFPVALNASLRPRHQPRSAPAPRSARRLTSSTAPGQPDQNAGGPRRTRPGPARVSGRPAYRRGPREPDGAWPGWSDPGPYGRAGSTDRPPPRPLDAGTGAGTPTSGTPEPA